MNRLDATLAPPRTAITGSGPKLKDSIRKAPTAAVAAAAVVIEEEEEGEAAPAVLTMEEASGMARGRTTAGSINSV